MLPDRVPARQRATADVTLPAVRERISPAVSIRRPAARRTG